MRGYCLSGNSRGRLGSRCGCSRRGYDDELAGGFQEVEVKSRRLRLAACGRPGFGTTTALAAARVFPRPWRSRSPGRAFRSAAAVCPRCGRWYEAVSGGSRIVGRGTLPLSRDANHGRQAGARGGAKCARALRSSAWLVSARRRRWRQCRESQHGRRAGVGVR